MSEGGEKTEQPTEKRLKDARKKGQVAKSQDLTSAVLLIAAVSILYLSGGYIGKIITGFLTSSLEFAVNFNEPFTERVAYDLFVEAMMITGSAVALLFGMGFILAFAIDFLQIGSVFSTETVKPNFTKLNPFPAFKQKFFKSRTYIELLKTVIKITVATYVVGAVLWDARSGLVSLAIQPPSASIPFLAQVFLEIGLKVGIAFLLIGGVDFMLQRFLHRKENKMSKKEVKDEYKEMEGDPYIKSKRRQIHREIIAQSMAAAVKKSNVVLVNPTHVAVALRYERGADSAPVIMAKGADLMAAKIREIAEGEGIPIKSDIPLARALYEFEIEEEVPEKLYEAVALVLKWVYEQQDK